MATPTKYRKAASSTKRILAEARELSEDDSGQIHASPLESDLFEWHFTIRLKHDEFAGGLYHGRILLPADYPLKPPEIMLLTPNGRFELQKKICLSITGYHAETWSPSWGIRTALMGLIAFFATESKGAIGGLDVAPEERKRLAAISSDWSCPTCRAKNSELLPPETAMLTAGPSSSTDNIADKDRAFQDSAAAALQQLMSRSDPKTRHERSQSEIEKARDSSANPTETAESAAISNGESPTIQDPPRVNETAAPRNAQPPPAWLDKVIVALVIVVIALVLKRAGITFGIFAAPLAQTGEHNATRPAAPTPPREQPTYGPGGAISH